VEALACREGMQLAAEWCPSKVILESDCNYVVGLLRHGNFQRSRLKFLLEETREAGNMLPEWTTVHVRRERNRAAHELAQLAKRTDTLCGLEVHGARLCRANYCPGV